MARAVTIDDIVREAKVGKGTVDRVLHNRGYVSEKTRKKVLKCIEELGYKPNTVARMLANKRTYRIAICHHEADTEQEFWDQLRNGIVQAQEEFGPMGIEVVEFILDLFSGDDQANAVRRIVEEGVDGLAIAAASAAPVTQVLNEAVAKGMPVVTFNTRIEQVNVPFVGIDGLASGRTAARLVDFVSKPGSHYFVFSPYKGKAKIINERKEGFFENIRILRPDMVCDGTFDDADDRALLEAEARRVALAFDSAYGGGTLHVTNETVWCVAKIVDELQLAHKINIVGYDLTSSVRNYIEKGVIDATIVQNPMKQAYSSIAMICRKLLVGEDMADDYLNIDIIVKENCRFEI